jgi:hypothetical protein
MCHAWDKIDDSYTKFAESYRTNTLILLKYDLFQSLLSETFVISGFSYEKLFC